MQNTKKIWIITVALLLAITISGGATVAYLMAKTPEVENSFTPVYVDCKVLEEFTGITKSNVRVQNTGDISAYMRATYVVMWVADDGSIWGVAPKAGVDYSLELGSELWQLGSDGFYYYASSVASGEVTETLINSLSLLSEAPEGHRLVVHVAATAIQAEPASAVEGLWGVTIADGALIAP